MCYNGMFCAGEIGVSVRNVVTVRGEVVYKREGRVGFPLLLTVDGHETMAEASL